MPLLKYSPQAWKALKLKQGIYTRLPEHYLKSLEPKTPTPVHWKPLGVQYRLNPKTGQKERVQDVPIPIYYPPESQDGLWGGEGWISGYRYANNDKVSCFPTVCWLVSMISWGNVCYGSGPSLVHHSWEASYCSFNSVFVCHSCLISGTNGNHGITIKEINVAPWTSQQKHCVLEFVALELQQLGWIENMSAAIASVALLIDRVVPDLNYITPASFLLFSFIVSGFRCRLV